MHSDITSKIRTLVSKQKKRYEKEGFNLDLSYVTKRIIAMGFPAENFEAIYRNNIDEVVKFFDLHHSGNYKIYNLCRERSFDTSKFSGQTVRYPFDDHNPPAFTVLHACIQDIADFLAKSPENVVAINCKAGKGRTGVIVCCTMIYSNISKDATAALQDYGIKRTHNGKGVTIPSQIRYIYYYDHFIKNNLKYVQTPLWLRLIKFDMVPNIGNAELEFIIFQSDNCTKIHLSKTYKAKKHSRIIIFHENLSHPLCDDLKFQFFSRSIISGTKMLCQCWLNTFFVVNQPAVQSLEPISKNHEKKCHLKNANCKYFSKSVDHIDSQSSHSLDSQETIYKVILTKPEIDKANKDVCNKTFPENFSITFLFSNSPPNQIYPETTQLNLGNSTFFERTDDENMISELEAMWNLSSSQFFTSQF